MGKYCVNCGKELHTGARFCAKCGTAVLDAPTARPSPAAPPQPKTEVFPQSNPAPMVPKRQKSAAAKKSGDGRSALCIALAVLLVIQIAAVTLYGWPGVLVKDRPQKLGGTGIENGVAELDHMSVDFGGTYAGTVLENAKVSPLDLDEGAASVGYELAFADIPEGEMTLSAPTPEGLTLADNERLYLEIGFAMRDEAGEEVMVYDHIEASEQSGQMTAQITPSGYGELPGNVYLRGEGFVTPTHSDKMRFDAQFKVKLISASQSGRFNLIFDRSRFVATTV